MAHLSENSRPLKRNEINKSFELINPSEPNLEFIIFPFFKTLNEIPRKDQLYLELNNFLGRCPEGSTILILCSPLMAADFTSNLTDSVSFKIWIAVKNKDPLSRYGFLEQKHSAILVLTKYKDSIKHTKTRISYSYCPFCERTTKDYGGKKHLYHEFGTLMSDVWRDIEADFDSDKPDEIISRLQDLFGIAEYSCINIYDHREHLNWQPKEPTYKDFERIKTYTGKSSLFNGDCLEILREIPDNSIDFCFADPPYNLKKRYESWDDDIDIARYFEWCDRWLTELARVLKPGRTLAVLNIPQWCVRYFKHLNNCLDYQDWIVWDAMSMPVRMIMPSHYTVICFSKGQPRPLPGLFREIHSDLEKNSITTLKEKYCARKSCLKERKKSNINDSELVENIWWDIHRLKHNSKRVDHPCQLPSGLMHRLISLFSNEGEIVLDPFDGVGTTTLAAQQLNRKFIGIEYSKYYHDIAFDRHKEISLGLDPFRKNNEEKPKAKNSPVERLKKQKYEVTKKELQLEVKNIASYLGHIPTKKEVKQYSKYPIKYFEEYFISWGEVTAAARTTGMTEYKKTKVKNNKKIIQK